VDDEALLPRRPQFPLASVAGALQRRITARYDDLARASQAHSLTTDQVSMCVRPIQCKCSSTSLGFLADLTRYYCPERTIPALMTGVAVLEIRLAPHEIVKTHSPCSSVQLLFVVITSW
jgi:hypothetical protein